MIKDYVIENYTIRVSFNTQIIQITNDDALSKLLETDIETRTANLVKLIKKDYVKMHGDELQISDDSLMIEIWGHVYFEYLILAIKKLFPINITARLSEIILKRSEIIDCGEKEKDNNRKIWDMLVPYKNFIARIVSRKSPL